MQNRKRLSPEESRAAAVAAARALLREEGVAAVTLKAVGARIGRTHANLLHHFGSVAGLHRALAEDIAQKVSDSINEAIGRRRRGEASERDVVDAMFDAFAEQRAGELIGWIALTRQREALKPVADTIQSILEGFRDAGDTRPMDRVTLGLVLLAIGDSLAGSEIAAATGLPRAAVRDDAVGLIKGIAGDEGPPLG
ncbi:TetR family transcriptional regulator [Sphingomonas edaphi]|uniref:TetR/AcrR family transcriptional regulator n=1 Tax=Sphingomonas edaphi TaxID=2315689 RepID=A0A418Q0U4_9SPHN|nr:TetR family transcriptional regulator [Sphingomonas edaphi]RIX29459.1 TetR/AcrR family transcriptional regulator [Sphingomonas edaphi]